ncbi:hypothetical protein CRYUN_Cryun23aG0116900 [Craigia yunnanensis]
MMVATEPIQSNGNLKLQINEILEECKTFFFVGLETTSNLLNWTVLLLSIHPEWQAKLREEVLEECGMGIPDADLLAKLKLVTFQEHSLISLKHCLIFLKKKLKFLAFLPGEHGSTGGLETVLPSDNVDERGIRRHEVAEPNDPETYRSNNSNREDSSKQRILGRRC